MVIATHSHDDRTAELEYYAQRGVKIRNILNKIRSTGVYYIGHQSGVIIRVWSLRGDC